MTHPKPASLTLAARCTLYVLGTMGVVKTEVTGIAVALVKYAQYASAVQLTFTPKGKRNPRSLVDTHEPAVLILDGWGHPDPDGMWDPASVRQDGQVTTMRGRYGSCDPRWRSGFDAMVAEYLARSGAKVLADYRGHNTYEQVAA